MRRGAAALVFALGCAGSSARSVDGTRAERPVDTRSASTSTPDAGAPEELEACLERALDDAIRGLTPSEATALYRRARLADKERGADDARVLYSQLVQAHPRSPLVPFVHFRLAQLFHADARDDPTRLAPARLAYEEVLRQPGSGLERAASALLADVLARNGVLDRALADAVRAAEATADGAICAPGARAAGLDVIVAVYPQVGDPKKAAPFTRRLAKDNDEFVMTMLRVSEGYLEQKDESLAERAPDYAVIALDGVLSDARLEPTACRRASDVLDRASSRGAGGVAEARRALTERCGAR